MILDYVTQATGAFLQITVGTHNLVYGYSKVLSERSPYMYVFLSVAEERFNRSRSLSSDSGCPIFLNPWIMCRFLSTTHGAESPANCIDYNNHWQQLMLLHLASPLPPAAAAPPSQTAACLSQHSKQFRKVIKDATFRGLPYFSSVPLFTPRHDIPNQIYPVSRLKFLTDLVDTVFKIEVFNALPTPFGPSKRPQIESEDVMMKSSIQPLEDICLPDITPKISFRSYFKHD